MIRNVQLTLFIFSFFLFSFSKKKPNISRKNKKKYSYLLQSKLAFSLVSFCVLFTFTETVFKRQTNGRMEIERLIQFIVFCIVIFLVFFFLFTNSTTL